MFPGGYISSSAYTVARGLGEAQATLGAKERIGPESFELLGLVDKNARSRWATRQ